MTRRFMVPWETIVWLFAAVAIKTADNGGGVR